MSPVVDVTQVGVEAVRPLRLAVLRAGLPPESAVWPGDDLPTSAHLAAYDGGALVGVATVLPSPYAGTERAWQLRGMAVDPAVRGRGVGAALLARAVELVAGSGTPLLWCNARVSAQGFYERHGFTVDSDVFVLPPLAVAHRRMSRLLP